MNLPSVLFLCCAPITAAVEMERWGHSWPWVAVVQLAVGVAFALLDERASR